mgnify:CR=1 FL=1
MENKRQPDEEDVPKIELYKVESSIVHADKMSRNAKILGVCASAVAIVAIIGLVFVVHIMTNRYNERTNRWIDAYSQLVTKITEVYNGNAETVQQFPPP